MVSSQIWENQRSENHAHQYGRDAPTSWKLFGFRFLSWILSMSWLMPACSYAHPLVTWLACAPLELCPLVLNIQWQILQMDLSYISSLLYFQVLSLQCSQDTVKYVVWLPEIFWSLKTLLTCSRCKVLYATQREMCSMKESAFFIAVAGSAYTGNSTVPEDRPRH